MPNLVNQILLADLQREFQKMGSCLVVSFDNLQPEQDIAIRGKLREVGVRYRVVRNRLASKAFSALKLNLDPILSGKCAIAIAEKEGAITAAKVLRDYIKKSKAQSIADLPDRFTVQTMIAQAVSGPARSVATLLNAVAGGVARCIQARVDKGGGAA